MAVHSIIVVADPPVAVEGGVDGNVLGIIEGDTEDSIADWLGWVDRFVDAEGA